MFRMADFVIRNRWWVIVATVLITLVLGLQIPRIGLNADFSTYLRQDDPLVQQFNRIGDVFGGNATGMVLITGSDVFSPPVLTLVKELTAAVDGVEGITSVTSLSNVIDFRKTDGGIEVGRLLNQGEIPRDPLELSDLKRYVLQKERYVGNLVSRDGTATALILHFKGGADKQISQFATSLRVKQAVESITAESPLPPEVQIFFGGMPFMIFNMTTLITGNFTTLLPIMILLLSLILYFGFRHWAGVVFPLLVVGITDIWLIGLMALFELKFDLLTGIAPVILLALGSADAIHLLKRYFERRRLGDNARQSARLVYKEMGIPILLTTITTMVGFASLTISDFSVIQQFGLLTALGVLLALLVTLTLLPAILSFGISPGAERPAKRESPRGSIRGRILDRFSRLVYKHKAPVLVAAVFIVAVSAIAIPRIVKDVDWSLCLQKGSAPFHAEMLLREKFGGSLPVQILAEGDLKEPALLRTMQVIERRLETMPHVTQSQSAASILAEMNEVMTDRYQVPASRERIANLWLLIEDQEMMQRLVAEKENQALIQARLDTWHTAALVQAVDSINAFLQTLPPRLAVVDLRRLSPRQAGSFQEVRNRNMIRNLNRVLRKYGVEVPHQDLEVALGEISRFTIDEELMNALEREIVAYLKSPEAEISVAASTAMKLARSISSGGLANPGVDARSLAAIIRATLPGVSEEDADFLAPSLQEIIANRIGEAHISAALSAILRRVPASVRTHPHFGKEIKGILWEANENRMIMDGGLAEEVLPTNSPALVGEVSADFRQTGMAPLLNRMEEELTPTQTESLLISLLLIIVLLGIIFRSVVGGLLAVVPISITILVNFAVMGYTGIGLDSFTAMIASIAIGLGIDTDIHFISRLREELKNTRDELAAYQQTVRTTGLSIIINALAVGGGFLVLLAAGGQHIRRFGGLTALTVLVSALFTLSILPALLFWIKPRFLRRAMEAGAKTKHEEELPGIGWQPVSE